MTILIVKICSFRFFIENFFFDVFRNVSLWTRYYFIDIIINYHLSLENGLAFIQLIGTVPKISAIEPNLNIDL